MKRVYCWLLVIGLTISTIGCGGEETVTSPADGGEGATEELETTDGPPDVRMPPR